jgi:hypothetical protein
MFKRCYCIIRSDTKSRRANRIYPHLAIPPQNTKHGDGAADLLCVKNADYFCRVCLGRGGQTVAFVESMRGIRGMSLKVLRAHTSQGLATFDRYVSPYGIDSEVIPQRHSAISLSASFCGPLVLLLFMCAGRYPSFGERSRGRMIVDQPI